MRESLCLSLTFDEITPDALAAYQVEDLYKTACDLFETELDSDQVAAGLQHGIFALTAACKALANRVAELQLTAQQPAPAAKSKKPGLQKSLDGACEIIVNQEAELKQLRAAAAKEAEAHITYLESEVLRLEQVQAQAQEVEQEAFVFSSQDKAILVAALADRIHNMSEWMKYYPDEQDSDSRQDLEAVYALQATLKATWGDPEESGGS